MNGSGHKHPKVPPAPGDWHRFGVDWSPDGYVFYIDGREVNRVDKPVSETEQFLLISGEPFGYRPVKEDQTMHRRIRVGLLIQSSLEYGRGLLRGIGQYLTEHESWAIYHRPGLLFDALPPGFREWGPEGIIAQLESAKLIRQVRRMGLPTVDLFALHEIPGVPRLAPDHRAVTQIVADYFVARAYQHFAFCGSPGVYYSDLRSKHFAGHLKRMGHEPVVYQGARTAEAASVFDREAAGLLEAARLGRWVRNLPKPVALLASGDLRAQQVLSACLDQGIAVPGEVTVMGVGNDEVICRLCNPSLTCVDLNTEKIGYRAALLLEQMMSGRRPPRLPVVVEPRGIVKRKSTSALAISDPGVATAVQYIHDHLAEEITTQGVADHVALSRSTLQRRFTRTLGRSPREVAIEAQLDRVKQLLIDTDLPLSRIAELSGFFYSESMCRLFKRKLGLTPGQFRKRKTPRE